MPLTDMVAAGVVIPDTRLAREATELIRDRTDDLIYHHSRRVYFWGSLQGRNRGLSWDPELLYLGAMFHDLGLNAEFRTSGRRFEVDSADEGRSFMRSHGVPEDSIRRVWTAIALHTTPGVPEFMEPEVALVTAGVEYDVMGIGYDDVGTADRASITSGSTLQSPPGGRVKRGTGPRVAGPEVGATLSCQLGRVSSLELV